MEAGSGVRHDRPGVKRQQPPTETDGPMGPAAAPASSSAASQWPQDAALEEGGTAIEMPSKAPGEPAEPPTDGYGGGTASEGADGQASHGEELGGRAFPYWNKPSALSRVATVLCDLGTWGVYFGAGIPLEDYRLSGMIVAGVAGAGVGVQLYRSAWEKSLRVLWKVQPTLLSATWWVGREARGWLLAWNVDGSMNEAARVGRASR